VTIAVARASNQLWATIGGTFARLPRSLTIRHGTGADAGVARSFGLHGRVFANRGSGDRTDVAKRVLDRAGRWADDTEPLRANVMVKALMASGG
jgi:hypothetical protein